MDSMMMQVRETREVSNQVSEMAHAVVGLGEQIYVMNEHIKALENAVRKLTKVTNTQANALTRAMHERSEKLCRDYRIIGKEADVLKLIRKSFRETCGVRGVKELPMDSYTAAMKMIGMWEDYKALKGLRA